jgi:hypothetical protein
MVLLRDKTLAAEGEIWGEGKAKVSGFQDGGFGPVALIF